MRPGAPTRRGFLVGAVAAGVGVAGCGSRTAAAGHPTIPMRPVHGPGAAADRRILLAALAMERRTVAAYAACIPLLPAAQAHWAQALVVEEVEQTGALAKLIVLCGGTAPAQGRLPAIGHPRDAEAATALITGLEAAQLRRYLGWIGGLSGGAVRAGVASILSSDAQHLTAWRGADGGRTLGPAFAIAGPIAAAGPDAAPGGASTDLGPLRRLLAAQRLLLACDERVLSAAAFAPAPSATRRLVSEIRAQDAAHVAATVAALRARGATPAPTPVDDAAIDTELARHLIPGRPGLLRGPRDALGLLADCDRVAIGAAYVALSEISDGALATLVARMMASDAQHESLLFEAVHPGDVAGAMPFGVVEGIA